jgi:hypothetical protein
VLMCSSTNQVCFLLLEVYLLQLFHFFVLPGALVILFVQIVLTKNDIEQRRGVGFCLNFRMCLSSKVFQMVCSQGPQGHLSLQMMCRVQNANFQQVILGVVSVFNFELILSHPREIERTLRVTKKCKIFHN